MEDASVVTMMGRLLVSLVVVFALMALAAKVARKRGLGSAQGASPGTRIEVLARQGLGRTSSVQLVRVAGRTLVLGVTDASVQVLGEADPLMLEVEEALALVPEPVMAQQTPGWGPLVEFLKDRTARRA